MVSKSLLIVPLYQVQALEMMNQLDEDKNGELSFDEFCGYLEVNTLIEHTFEHKYKSVCSSSIHRLMSRSFMLMY